MSAAPKPPPLRLADGQAPPLFDGDGEFFARLPLVVLASRSLSDASKVLVAAIADSARASGACGDSNAVLAAKVGKDPATIPRLLRELEKAEVIEREQRGPFRSIRLNFRFRGLPARGESWRTPDPGSSARVGQVEGVAEAPAKPGRTASQPPRNCQPTLAPAPPTLRLSRAQQDPDQKSGAGPARVGQAPPDPSPDRQAGPDEVPQVVEIGPTPAPGGLPEEVRGRLPTPDVERSRRWRPAVHQGDVIADGRRASLIAALRGSEPSSRAYAEAWIDLARHNEAWHAVNLYGRSLPEAPEPSAHDEGSARRNARPLALDSREPGVPELGPRPQASVTGADPLSTDQQASIPEGGKSGARLT